MTNSNQAQTHDTLQTIDPLIEDTANRIFSDYCNFDALCASEQGEWQGPLWQAIQESGLSNIDTPESLNGPGAATIDALNVLRLAGYHGAPVPIADHYIASRIYQSLALEIPEEPISVVSPQQARKLKITSSKEGFILDGPLHNIPWARFSKSILIPVESNNQCSVLFLDRTDLTLTENTNMAGEPRDSLVFEGFRIPSEKALSCPLSINEIEQLGALTRSVMSWGALEKVMELAVDYAKERTQFGRPIAKFQAIQQDLAKLAGEVASAAVAVDHGIRRYCDANPHVPQTSLAGEASTYIAAAKIRSGEATGFATKVSHQIHGAMGFTNEHPLHHFSRRLWAWRDEYGSEAYWSHYLGKCLVDAPQPSLWQWVTAQ
ncbi:MAG: hypothetical protein KUG82_06210 [Pseudomonadales bacterium]|nr:hypothetical protein [Pseudomonadales bacterium]